MLRPGSRNGWAYSLGFFFGPGRPRSFGGASGSIAGGARLRPVPAEPPFFFLPSPCSGALELVSTLSISTGGTDAPFESDDLSVESGGGADGDGSVLMGLVEGDLVVVEFDGNCERASAVRWRIIIRLFFPPLLADLEFVVAVDIFFLKSVGDGEVERGQFDDADVMVIVGDDEYGRWVARATQVGAVVCARGGLSRGLYQTVGQGGRREVQNRGLAAMVVGGSSIRGYIDGLMDESRKECVVEVRVPARGRNGGMEFGAGDMLGGAWPRRAVIRL